MALGWAAGDQPRHPGEPLRVGLWVFQLPQHLLDCVAVAIGVPLATILALPLVGPLVPSAAMSRPRAQAAMRVAGPKAPGPRRRGLLGRAICSLGGDVAQVNSQSLECLPVMSDNGSA